MNAKRHDCVMKNAMNHERKNASAPMTELTKRRGCFSLSGKLYDGPQLQAPLLIPVKVRQPG